MTLPQEVQDAVSEVDAWLSGEPVYDDWQTIRAELHRLTEIAEGVDPLVIRLGEVTTRLEAANALLREIYAGDDWEQPARQNEALDRIQSHLQGAGDEA